MATKKPAALIPQTTGIFILLIIILAFTAGAVRNELALSLVGAVFLAVWLYCLILTLLRALLERKRALSFSIRVTPRETATGNSAQMVYADNGKSFWLPGILVRCRLRLGTKDGRRITRDFNPAPRRKGASFPVHGNKRRRDIDARDPDAHRTETFEVHERGAYFSSHDEFAVFDALGFFRFVYYLPCEAQPRLLACPRTAEEPPSPEAPSGGTEHFPEFRLLRSNTLTNHRPYMPGDDPRRINWKLFGHGGELFVRDGENEPPPHSNILILIDTHYDTLLYSAEEGRRGVDLLCENALAAALGCSESGMDVLTGFTGCENFLLPDKGNTDGKNAACLRGNSPAELAAIFACPAAIPWRAAKPKAELPDSPGGRGILIFALPRESASSSALNRFLDRMAKKCENKTRSVEIVFLYPDGGKETDITGAAETCANFYNRKKGVRARCYGGKRII